MSEDVGVTLDEVVAHTTPELVTPCLGKGTLGTWRFQETPGHRAGISRTSKQGLSGEQTVWSGANASQRLNLKTIQEGSQQKCQGQNRARKNRPSGIAGGSWET